MDNINSTLINRLSSKILKLLEQYKSMSIKYEELKAENTKLLELVENQKKEIKELEEKNKILKISNTINLKENSKEIKLKINEFLREINKCIDLLNNK
jgi:hypothetical protein